MKICCLSDTHGYLPEIEPCDLLIHAGDMTPVSSHAEPFQLSWLDTNFRHWLETVPAKKIIGIAGNHEFVFQSDTNAAKWIKTHLPWVYLQDRGTNYEGYKIWGSPWQPPFYDWAFNLPENELEKKWAEIPDDTEILITHGPPRNIRDREGRNEEHVGSRTLLERTWKLPDLKLHVFGHIHHDYGQVEVADAQFVNACYVDEGYRPTREPIYLTFPDK